MAETEKFVGLNPWLNCNLEMVIFIGEEKLENCRELSEVLSAGQDLAHIVNGIQCQNHKLYLVWHTVCKSKEWPTSIFS